MTTLSQKPIGQIVADDFRTAQVFRSYGLDFCCGGKKSLEESCERKNIDFKQVLADLSNLKQGEIGGHNFNEWSLDFLVDYIINNHHKYIRTKLPEVNFYAEKVARVHGSHHPELLDILRNVRELSEELLYHIDEEEKGIFEQIKDMVRNNNSENMRDALIAELEEQHEKAGALMEEIEQLSAGFTPPEDACASYRVLFQNLEAFQLDLHKHVHLENNILFPKALALHEQMSPN